MVSQRPFLFMAAVFSRRHLSFERSISFGLKSERYGGSKRIRAPNAWLASRMAEGLRAGRSFMATMSPGDSDRVATLLSMSQKGRAVHHAIQSVNTTENGGVCGFDAPLSVASHRLPGNGQEDQGTRTAY